jgi:hypothetical protein
MKSSAIDILQKVVLITDIMCSSLVVGIGYTLRNIDAYTRAVPPIMK